MDCNKARDLMLTDYLDDQMGEKEKARLEEHIARCPECRKVSLIAKKVEAELFLGAERANVPEYLWRRVRETILAEENRKKTFADAIFERLKTLLYIPKPALAILTVVVLLLAIGTVTKIKIDNQTSMNAEYFDYFTDNSINDNSAFGTSIEKYFM